MANDSASNQVELGADAQSDQLAAGSNISQRKIQAETYIENLSITLPTTLSSRFSLVPPPPDFTGRADEIKELVDKIEQGGGAYISGLVGLGGVGKTALARYVADKIKGNYPDAHIEIDLLGTRQALATVEIMRTVVRAFVSAEEKLPDEVGEVARLYRNVLHDKRILLLLDDAKDAGQLRDLLPLPNCAVIVTSRMYFTLQGLTPLRLDALKEDEAKELLLRLCPRIGNQADKLARLCGRLPLALEIAASFLKENDDEEVSHYLRELEKDRLALLRRDGEENMDVAAVFARSYNALPAGEQRAWRVLGVFPESFTTEAAGYVVGLQHENIAKLLQKLRRYSLLEWHEGRYRLHDLLREFARGKLSLKENWIRSKRHAGFYLKIANEIDELYLDGGGKTLDALHLFETEIVNLRVGREWTVKNMQANSDTARLANLYGAQALEVRRLRLHPHESLQWNLDSEQAARILRDDVARAAHLTNIGVSYQNLGEKKTAIEYSERALAIYRKIADRKNEGALLGNIGHFYSILGEGEKAVEYLNQAIIIAHETENRRVEGNDRGNLGSAYHRMGKTSEAIKNYEEALNIAKETGDLKKQGNWLGNLGVAYWNAGNTERSLEYYENALSIARKIGDKVGEGNHLNNIAIVLMAQERLEEANTLLEKAITIAHDGDTSKALAKRLQRSGQVLLALKERDKTRVALTEAIQIFQERGEDASDALKMLTELDELPQT